jgi:FkbM family methyltransferase
MSLELERQRVRALETFTIELDGVKTQFHDQGGVMARCHRVGAFYEQGMLQHIAGMRREGVYLDVGANIGNHTLFFAQHCPATMVHAFEPIQMLVAHVLENVEINDLSTVEVHPFGLSDEPRLVDVNFNSTPYTLDCKRLDDVHIDGRIVVVKVDIEGMEAAFLRGARQTLRRHKPVLFVEAATVQELRAVTRELRQIGYEPTGRVFNATPTHEFIPLGSRVMFNRRVGRLLPARVRRAISAQLRRAR